MVGSGLEIQVFLPLPRNFILLSLLSSCLYFLPVFMAWKRPESSVKSMAFFSRPLWLDSSLDDKKS